MNGAALLEPYQSLRGNRSIYFDILIDNDLRTLLLLHYN